MQNKSFKISILFLITILLVTTNSFAQRDKKSLQNKYNTILKDIKGIENMIEETETKKKQSLSQLQSLSAKIDSRETLIENINAQIVILDETIGENKSICKNVNIEIDALKKDYASMVLHSYKNLKTTSMISFLLSSDNFNQAMRRLNYLKSYAKSRQRHAVILKETIAEIERKVERLEAEKAEKEQLLLEEKHQQTILVTEKIQKDNIITKLKDASINLQAQATQKNTAALALNNQIQKIIKEEILSAQAKVKRESEKAANGSKSSEDFVKKELKLSTDFVNNKGKLPWPVKKGFVIEKFGKHAHPTLKGVVINNNGIDIRTEKSQAAVAIFKGQVVNSFYLPTTQNTIIVKHGEYFSVYSNLKSISVNLGDMLTTGQKIGEPYTSDDNTTKIHLEVWKSTTKLNPEYWIKPSI